MIYRRITVTLSVITMLLSAPALLRAERLTSLDALATKYTTPRAIARFLVTEFVFQKDIDIFGCVEHCQTPLEFLARRTGDCEDYALLARELFMRNGIEAYIFSLFGDNGYAHTVCIFVDEHGRYNVLNQDKLQYYRAPSLEALADALCPEWLFGGLVEQAGIRGRLVKEIRNRPSGHSVALLTSGPHVPY
jgi:transglutaminase-like putative cysteine protease